MPGFDRLSSDVPIVSAADPSQRTNLSHMQSEESLAQPEETQAPSHGREPLRNNHLLCTDLFVLLSILFFSVFPLYSSCDEYSNLSRKSNLHRCLVHCRLLQSNMARRYDTRATIFSPEGRLYQVEYALEAISHSGASLGILAENGVVLAGEKRNVSPLLDDVKYSEKIYKIHDDLCCSVSGITSDANVLINELRMIGQRYVSTFGIHDDDALL